MIRLFKHYIPNALLLLAICDFGLLIAAADLGWIVRAREIHMHIDAIQNRIPQLLTFALSLQAAMIGTGVYGVNALNSLRFATARLFVAVSLGIILVSLLAFVLPGSTLWRSNLLYAMIFSLTAVFLLRLVLGNLIGSEAFKRRVLVMGAGPRALRIRKLAERPGAGFSVVGYIAMNDCVQVIPSAINRAHIESLSDHTLKLGASELVLALQPDNAAVSNTYGWLLFQTSANHAEGLNLLEKAVHLAPADPALRLQLGEAYAAIGQRGAARYALEPIAANPRFAEQPVAARLLAHL